MLAPPNDADILNAIFQAEALIHERGFATLDDLCTWEDLAAEYSEFTWAWPKWLPNGCVTMLAAAPGIGKSMLALNVVRIMAHGGVWPDGTEHPASNKRVLWVETEAGEPFHIKRANTIGISRRTIVTPRPRGAEPMAVKLNADDMQRRIQAILADDGICMAVIDSLSGGHNLDENSTETGRIMQWMAEAARSAAKPILVVHHMNKSGMRATDQLPTLADIRGSSSITQYARVIWTLDTPDNARPHILRLNCLKSNLDVKGGQLGVEIVDGGRLQWTSAPLSQQDYARNDVRTKITDYQRRYPTHTISQAALALGIDQITAVQAMAVRTDNFHDDLF